MSDIELKIRGWQRILLLILPYVFVILFFQLIGGLIAGIDLDNLDNLEPDATSVQQLIIMFFNLLGTFLVLWVFMKFVDKERFIKLGFQTKNRFRGFIFGIGIGLLIMLIGYLLLIYWKEIIFLRIIFDFKELVISILLYTMVAIAEETLFRGYILRNLMISFNKYLALIISSIIFSLVHSLNQNIDLFSLFGLFLVGILLGLSYIHTKNLWFPIAVHLSWNLFQTLFGFNVSGHDTYSLIEFKIHEANLINGGAFGFEGSFLSIIAQIIVITAISIYYNQNKKTDAI